MKELIMVPLIATIILSFVAQLEPIAKESSDKAIEYAQDMNNAMECATKGIPISKCSPNLMDTSFTKELEETQRILENMTLELNNTIMSEN
jgi:hypothetical protein